jgi:hypothetical protein
MLTINGYHFQMKNYNYKKPFLHTNLNDEFVRFSGGK